MLPRGYKEAKFDVKKSQWLYQVNELPELLNRNNASLSSKPNGRIDNTNYSKIPFLKSVNIRISVWLL